MSRGSRRPRAPEGADLPRPGLSEGLWPIGGTGYELDVVGLGENSLDRLNRILAWPAAGQKQEILESTVCPGGQVASAMLGCARLGLRSAYLGAVGADAAADCVLVPLREAGIDLSGVQRISGAATRQAQILIRDGDGERSVLAQTDPGLRVALDRLDRRSVEKARLLLVDTSDLEASLWAAGVARDAGIPVVLDADRPVDGIEKLLGRVDFPVVSESFTRAWADGDSPAAGLEKLTHWGGRLAVVTCGADGARAAFGPHRIHAPAVSREIRDTTGAGDAFHAGLIWAILKGYGAREALDAANAVASFSCAALGAQAGLPSQTQLREFLARPKPGPRDAMPVDEEKHG